MDIWSMRIYRYEKPNKKTLLKKCLDSVMRKNFES